MPVAQVSSASRTADLSRRPSAVADLLGEEGLNAFTSLTSVTSDGWGMAWQTHEGTRTRSSPCSADIDETYRDLVEDPLSHAGFVHLRWATGGLDVRRRTFTRSCPTTPRSRATDLATREVTRLDPVIRLGVDTT